jgi:hypothetical protein
LRRAGLERALARTLAQTSGLAFGIEDLREEGRWEQRFAAKKRRNGIRRIRRAERKLIRAPIPD